MSILESAPAALRAVESIRHDLQVGHWSLDSLADDLDVDERWQSCPSHVLALIVIDHIGAVITMADYLRGTDRATVVRGRCLAEVIAVRASGKPLPYCQIVTRDAWRIDRSRRPIWAAGMLLAVSQADVFALNDERTTIVEIAALRHVPDWLVWVRCLQEIMYGHVDGDAVAATCEALTFTRQFLDWIADDACISKVVT